MPRKRRVWRPGSAQHVISRFVDREFKFESTSDRRTYLQYVEDAHKRWDWRWVSFSLMGSHIHDGQISGVVPLDSFYRSVHGRYAQRYQRRYGSLGSIFAGRPNNYEVRSEQILRLVAYHHLNPVDAGVVSRPADSTWTSHRAYLRLEKSPAFLDVEWALPLMGFDDTPSGRLAFDEFVRSCDIRALRDEFAPHRYDPYRASLVSKADVCPAVALDVLADAASQLLAIDASALSRGRTRRDTFSRRVFVASALSEGHTLTAISRYLGHLPSTISNLVKRTMAEERAEVERLAAKAVLLARPGPGQDV